MARIRIGEQPGQLFCPPGWAVGVVDQAHHRQFKIWRDTLLLLEPLMQFVLLEQAESGVGLHLVALVALVIDNREPAVGSDGMQLLGDQQVKVPIVLFQRGEARGVPTYIKRGAQRIISCRHLADRRHAAPPPFPYGFRVWLCRHGAISGPRVLQQSAWQIDRGQYGYEKVRQKHSQCGAGQFQHTPRAPPAHALRVVEDGSALFHRSFQANGKTQACQ